MNKLGLVAALCVVAGCLSPVDESLRGPTDAGGGGAGGGGGGAGGGGSAMRTLVTTELKSDPSWRVTGTPPAAGWNSNPNFDHSAWASAVLQIPQGPESNNSSIWDGATPGSGSQQLFIRRAFTPMGEVESATLTVACNDDMDVWINGTQVVSEADGYTSYRRDLDVRGLLIPGENLIAANCRDVLGPEHSFHSWLVLKTWQ